MELCQLSDGRTIVALFSGVLPSQPVKISASIQELVASSVILNEIKEKSPVIKRINSAMIEKIRDKYSIEDECYFSRIGIAANMGIYTFLLGEREAILEFGAFVESVRSWGKTERSKYGL